jgi:hypothetical protein
MKFLKSIAAGVVFCGSVALNGCSKDAEPSPASTAETNPAPAAAAPDPQPARAVAPAAVVNVQQAKADWDAVTQKISNQDYDNAVRQAILLNQLQQQANLNETVRKEYERRMYEAQEALRKKAETDANARAAYQKLGRALMGR